MFNSTLLLSNATNSLIVCLDAWENYDHYVNTWMAEFEGGFTGVMTAFFQNLIGNAITLTRYQVTITTQSEA